MKKLLIGLVVLLLFPINSYATTQKDATAYVQALANQTLAIISNDSVSKDEKDSKMKDLFTKNVDMAWIGKFVMGQYWRTATDTQKTRFLQEYQKFLLTHYALRLTDYTGGKFNIVNSRTNGDNDFSVSTEMQSDDNNQPVDVEYRVHVADNGNLKVIDIDIEGVSLITTQRSEFGSVIQQHGIDYLINKMSTMSAPN